MYTTDIYNDVDSAFRTHYIVLDDGVNRIGSADAKEKTTNQRNKNKSKQQQQRGK